MYNPTNPAKVILIAPLDWGLGHTTRCIPIIKELQKYNCKIIIAATDSRKKLLENEFSNLTFVDIPNYNIQYAKTKLGSKIKLLSQLPKIKKAIVAEQNWLLNFVKNNKIDAIISDNRYGLFHNKITAIFITHQLQPLSFIKNVGENIIQNTIYKYINKFSECWVIDEDGENNLAGKLSHPKKMPDIPVTYIGNFTRFEKKYISLIYDACIIISGPEPQRTIFENIIVNQLKVVKLKSILVRGLPNNNINTLQIDGCTIYNHLDTKELNNTILQSKYIISRSGYTTVMDLLILQKKCIFIPTPSQTEQEYLAKYLNEKKYCISYNQSNFKLSTALENANQFDFKNFENVENNNLQKSIHKLINY